MINEVDVGDEGRNNEEREDGRKGMTRKYVRKEKKMRGQSLDLEEVAQ